MKVIKYAVALAVAVSSLVVWGAVASATTAEPAPDAEVICTSTGPNYVAWQLTNTGEVAIVSPVALAPGESEVIESLSDEQGSVTIVVEFADGTSGEFVGGSGEGCMFVPPVTPEPSAPEPELGSFVSGCDVGGWFVDNTGDTDLILFPVDDGDGDLDYVVEVGFGAYLDGGSSDGVLVLDSEGFIVGEAFPPAGCPVTAQEVLPHLVVPTGQLPTTS